MRSKLGWLAGLLAAILPVSALGQAVPQSGDFQVNTYTTGYQRFPAMALDSDGDFIVAWEDRDGQDGSSMGVFAQRYSSAGVPSGPEFQVNSYTDGVQYRPAVAMHPGGRFVVVWTDGYGTTSLPGQDGSQGAVFLRRFGSTGVALDDAVQVSVTTLGHQADAAVDMNADGDFVVVWLDASGQFGEPWRGIFGRRYASSGSPLGGEFQVHSSTEYFRRFSPAVAVDAAGGFVVVWESSPCLQSLDPAVCPTADGSFSAAFGRRFGASGAALGPEFRINTFTTGIQSDPDIVMDGSGNFVVAWRGPGPGTGFGIIGQRFSSAGTPLGPEFTLSSPSAVGQKNFPALAGDAAGRFVAVWNSLANQGGDSASIQGRAYDALGAPIGPEFPVNAYTTGTQFAPAVALDEAGRFIVAWEDGQYPLPGRDGSADSIYAQRFVISSPSPGPSPSPSPSPSPTPGFCTALGCLAGLCNGPGCTCDAGPCTETFESAGPFDVVFGLLPAARGACQVTLHLRQPDDVLAGSFVLGPQEQSMRFAGLPGVWSIEVDSTGGCVDQAFRVEVRLAADLSALPGPAVPAALSLLGLLLLLQRRRRRSDSAVRASLPSIVSCSGRSARGNTLLP